MCELRAKSCSRSSQRGRRHGVELVLKTAARAHAMFNRGPEWDPEVGLAATQRYAALLRGVSPMNCKMPLLAQCFEDAGFTDVKTLLSSGNVVFNAARVSDSTLRRRIEKAMQETLGRTFLTFIRSVATLQRMVEADPYARFKLRAGSKRIVTFLLEPPTARLDLPIELHGARILDVQGCEVFGAYVRSDRGPVFMQLLDKTFGKQQTTRTWETVQKVARA
jgi:uncharacterized protein (DUF1697 family)